MRLRTTKTAFAFHIRPHRCRLQPGRNPTNPTDTSKQPASRRVVSKTIRSLSALSPEQHGDCPQGDGQQHRQSPSPPNGVGCPAPTRPRNRNHIASQPRRVSERLAREEAARTSPKPFQDAINKQAKQVGTKTGVDLDTNAPGKGGGGRADEASPLPACRRRLRNTREEGSH